MTTFLAFDVGATRARVLATCEPSASVRRELEWCDMDDPRQDLERLVEIAREALCELSRGAPVAVGVALAALVKNGTVVSWPNRPSWQALEVASVLESQLGASVVIEDDANAAALGEHRYGAGRGCSDMLYVSVGSGVGAGLILSGELRRGVHGWAGELGHVSSVEDGPRCGCGSQGCLQTVASGRALEKTVTDLGLISVAALIAAAERGEREPSAALGAAAQHLAVAVSGAINLLDVERIVVGGHLTDSPFWWNVFSQTVKVRTINAAERSLEVLPGECGDNAALLGALERARRLNSSTQAGL